MGEHAPLCGRCGYPTRGLDRHRCPECGVDEQPAAGCKPGTGLVSVLHPRRACLATVWRNGATLRPAARNIGASAVMGGGALVWAWLLDPISGVLARPFEAMTILFHLTFLAALALAVLGTCLIAFEHAAVLTASRMMRVSQPGRVARRIAALSTDGLALGAAAMLALVAVVRFSGLEGALADGLPLGGVIMGVASSLRTTAAGVWAAGLLRDAGW